MDQPLFRPDSKPGTSGAEYGEAALTRNVHRMPTAQMYVLLSVRAHIAQNLLDEARATPLEKATVDLEKAEILFGEANGSLMDFVRSHKLKAASVHTVNEIVEHSADTQH